MERALRLVSGIPVRLTKCNRAAAYCYWAAATAWLLGIILTLSVLVRYTSWSNRRVLGRWSEIHFGLIILFVILFVGILFRVWREHSAKIELPVPALLSRVFLGMGVFTWSGSFFLSSLDDKDAGGRLLDFQIFASTLPVPIFLEWIALVFLFVGTVLISIRAINRTLTKDGPISKWMRFTLAILITVGAAVLLLEAGIRAMNVAVPRMHGFAPKVNALWGRRFVRLNSLAYRDRDHPLKARDGTKRILLVGGYFPFGADIKTPGERFGERLEEGLNRLSTKERFEVINAGTLDSNTLDHIETLRRMLVFRPDYVLLLYSFNDINYLSKPDYVPPRSIIGEIRTPLDRVHPLRLLVLNSHLAEQMSSRLRKGVYRYVCEDYTHPVIYPYEIEAVLEMHLKDLDRFFRLAGEAKAEAVLIPQEINAQHWVSYLTRYENFVRAAKARGIRVWPLIPAFEGHHLRDLTDDTYERYPNALMNELASAAILERFRSEFLGTNLAMGRRL